MNDAPYAEALVLLAEPLICEEVPAWKENNEKPGLAITECGLMSEDGSRAGLHVVMQVGQSKRTGIVTYKFTVFRMNLGAAQRVYQLQINAVAHAPKNWHETVHEHMGDARIEGSVEWLKWGFYDALDYFCKRANITFIPPLVDPYSFELRPS